MTMPKSAAARPESVDGAQAIRRAITTLKAVAQLQRSGANLTRVAQATGFSRSTTFRILRSLTEERMLRFDEAGRGYFLGALAFELGLATRSEGQIQHVWTRAVEDVARRTRLTSYLMAISGDEAVCLLCVQGSEAIRAVPINVGDRLPLGTGAGSLAILASLTDEEVHRIVEGQARQAELYPGGRGRAEQTLKRVDLARSLGFAQSSGTVGIGLSGVGVAFQPSKGFIQLAISVSAVADIINAVEARQFASIIQQAIHASNG